MLRRCLAAVLPLAFVAFVAPAAPVAAASELPSAPLNFPISVTSASQGTFNGNLHLVRFDRKGGTLFAFGVVTGTLLDENGVMTSIVRTVSLPVTATSAGTSAASSAAAAAADSCGILHLELGPLDLDLLGLVVHLDRVVLDLTAVPGAGNLLGNLLCAVTNLLNTPNALGDVASLLNAIVALLG
jgi:hypothetical protein